MAEHIKMAKSKLLKVTEVHYKNGTLKINKH